MKHTEQNGHIVRKFAEFVQHQRKKLGISQSSLAKRALGRSDHSYISRIENHERENITTDTMEKILNVLDSEVEFYQLKK